MGLFLDFFRAILQSNLIQTPFPQLMSDSASGSCYSSSGDAGSVSSSSPLVSSGDGGRPPRPPPLVRRPLDHLTSATPRFGPLAAPPPKRRKQRQRRWEAIVQRPIPRRQPDPPLSMEGPGWSQVGFGFFIFIWDGHPGLPPVGRADNRAGWPNRPVPLKLIDDCDHDMRQLTPPPPPRSPPRSPPRTLAACAGSRLARRLCPVCRAQGQSGGATITVLLGRWRRV